MKTKNMTPKRGMCGVYKIVCALSHNFYIGSSRDVLSRWHQHTSNLRKGNHHSFKLQRAWNKHGSEAFSIQVITVLSDPLLCIRYERSWMWKLKPKYNGSIDPVRTCLGHKFGPPSDATRKKISMAVTGFKHTEETKKKMRGPRPYMKVTAKQIANLRPVRLGDVLSAATRKKISEVQIGKHVSWATRKRQSKALKGKPWSVKRRLAEATKKQYRSLGQWSVARRLAQTKLKGRN